MDAIEEEGYRVCFSVPDRAIPAQLHGMQALSSEAGQAPPAVAQASRQRREDLAAAMEEARDVLRYWARRCAEQGPR